MSNQHSNTKSKMQMKRWIRTPWQLNNAHDHNIERWQTHRHTLGGHNCLALHCFPTLCAWGPLRVDAYIPCICKWHACKLGLIWGNVMSITFRSFHQIKQTKRTKFYAWHRKLVAVSFVQHVNPCLYCLGMPLVWFALLGWWVCCQSILGLALLTDSIELLS